MYANAKQLNSSDICTNCSQTIFVIKISKLGSAINLLLRMSVYQVQVCQEIPEALAPFIDAPIQWRFNLELFAIAEDS